MTRAMICASCLLVAWSGGLLSAAGEKPDLSISADPYLSGGLFVKPFLPHPGDKIAITVRANLTHKAAGLIPARLEVLDRNGQSLAQASLGLVVKDAPTDGGKSPAPEFIAEADWNWSSQRTGLFRLRATVDPDNTIAESNEDNNRAELDLAVVIPQRKLFFPWYSEHQRPIRWGNVITSASSKDAQRRLAERDVKALAWQYGGASWRGHDDVRKKQGEAEAMKQIEAEFRQRYLNVPEGADGIGIDEMGGYPGSWSEQRSIAMMRALRWAKQQRPDTFYAVWLCGGGCDSFKQYFREAADVVLLEVYIWNALPNQLKTEEIYKFIRGRIEPYYRNHDTLLSAYGSPCHVIVGLDVAEAVDVTNLGELEEVVRFIRQEFPELRGQGWYSGSLSRNRQGQLDEARHQQIIRFINGLNLKYYIKPCLTFLEKSLWMDDYRDGKLTLSAAVSNLGAMDAGPIAVEFLADGKSLGIIQAKGVPAGENRNTNRTHFTITAPMGPGTHRFEAQIQKTDGFATVVNCSIDLARFLNE